MFQRDRSVSAFEASRMPLGDHLAELQGRMWRALQGLFVCLVAGFILDGLGDATHTTIGLGKPMLRLITEPIEKQVGAFYARRTEASHQKQLERRSTSIDQSLGLPVRIPTNAFLRTFKGLELNDLDTPAMEVELAVDPAEIDYLAKVGELRSGSRAHVRGFGIMEPMTVYIKVSLLCGVVIACPWIFWQMWAFVGAGLYPHEKKLVHVYLPFSILLFLGGCVVCQFIVMPKAVAAMLSFYDWINVDPDLRLNEWLSFAILMPLVFGVSFQTPLVMLFLNRIGLFGWDVYLAKWRYALFLLSVVSVVLTPTTDVVSLLWLLVPTFGLYMVGVVLCYLQRPNGANVSASGSP